ncbi:hypothetical protein MTO98_26400 [Mucilaginibacter sp. SMC90]|uniref:hypothetical protein n=1 Tax=Mucilaginibacter sp. SMC90 TaxID=2929803 RepID=UPI001FB1B1C7|nr:hypothetical protein [Mucilaginibacter sp. SMC90]UOE47946.1 hypothetical protein MTO98_26400 [Mucilaginibacter sp. SMC90]
MKQLLIYILIIACFSSQWALAAKRCNSNITFRPVMLMLDTPLFNPDIDMYGAFTPMILPQQLQYHVNEKVFTQGKVYDAHVDLKSNAVLLSLGNERAVERVTIIIKNKYRVKFDHPEISLLGKTITVLGWVIHYKGDSAMKLNDPKNLQISHSED